MVKDLILKNRSYRRFDESIKISSTQIEKWIDLARCSASARNAQPLKYAIITNSETSDIVFPSIAWAGYLKDWQGPAEGERPTAYIAVLKDKSISEKHYCDDGIAMQSILLGAVEDGFGGCIIGAVNRKKVSEILNLPEHLEILWIIALGKPSEKVVIEKADGDIKYWRDQDDIHHVPKRDLDEIIYRKQE